MNYCYYFRSFQPEATQAQTMEMQSPTVAPPNMKEHVLIDTCVLIPNQIPFAKGWRTKRRTVQLTNLHVHMVLDEALTSTAEGSDLYYALHLENTS